MTQKPEENKHDWDALMRYLRTSYQAHDMTMTQTDVGARIDVELGSERVSALVTPAVLASEDFATVWKLVDEAIGRRLKEIREGIGVMRHPDDLLVKWEPEPGQPSLPLDEWTREDAEATRKQIARPPEPRHKVEAPDLTQWVLGYRTWLPGMTPISYTSTGGWKGGHEVRAICGAGRKHAAPDTACSCGFYAYTSPNRINWQASGHTRPPPMAGVVRARGVMFTAKEGFRSEYAQPLALGYAMDARAPVEAFGKRWGLPALPFEYLAEFAKDYGSPLPDSMRPIEHWETRWTLTCAWCQAEQVVLMVKKRLDEIPTDKQVMERLVSAVAAYRDGPCPSCENPMQLATLDYSQEKVG